MVHRNVLSGQIGVLVDHLRETSDKRIEIADIASITEVLIATMEAYFRSIDTKIYTEFRDLSDYIDNARTEIASLVPTDIKSSRLPRAGLELDAIVKSTEEATNGIMEAAEAIMALPTDDMEAYKAAIEAECMRIFEQCSFQDITGQRISKVVETLQHIEGRIDALRDIWGVDRNKVEDDTASEDGSHLLRGPALEGEGINQTEVDALLGEEAAADAADEEAPDAETAEAEEVAETVEEADAEEAPEAEAAAAEEVAEEAPEAETAEAAVDDVADAVAEAAEDAVEEAAEAPEAPAPKPAAKNPAADAKAAAAKPAARLTDTKAKAKPAAAKTEAKAEPAAETEPAPAEDAASEEATQAEIDALFA